MPADLRHPEFDQRICDSPSGGGRGQPKGVVRQLPLDALDPAAEMEVEVAGAFNKELPGISTSFRSPPSTSSQTEFSSLISPSVEGHSLGQP